MKHKNKWELHDTFSLYLISLSWSYPPLAAQRCAGENLSLRAVFLTRDSLVCFILISAANRRLGFPYCKIDTSSNLYLCV